MIWLWVGCVPVACCYGFVGHCARYLKLYSASNYPDEDELPEEFRVTDTGTNSDLLMAQMLQMEFNKEADKRLKLEQDHYNGKSKVMTSYSSASN